MMGTLAMRGGLVVSAFFFSLTAIGENALIERGIPPFDERVKRYPPDRFHLIGLGTTTAGQSAVVARAAMGAGWKDYFSELPVGFFNEFETLSPVLRRSLLAKAETERGRTAVVFRVLMSGALMRHYLPDFAERQLDKPPKFKRNPLAAGLDRQVRHIKQNPCEWRLPSLVEVVK